MLRYLVSALGACVAISVASVDLIGQGGRGAQPATGQRLTAIRAGRLVNPETASVATNQIILVDGERIREVGANVTIPQGTEIIDLSRLIVLPGLVDTHT